MTVSQDTVGHCVNGHLANQIHAAIMDLVWIHLQLVCLIFKIDFISFFIKFRQGAINVSVIHAGTALIVEISQI